MFCLLVLALRLQTSVLFMGFRAPWFSHHGSFLFEIWLAKTDPHLTSEEPAAVSKYKKAAVCPAEKIHPLDELGSGSRGCPSLCGLPRWCW